LIDISPDFWGSDNFFLISYRAKNSSFLQRQKVRWHMAIKFWQIGEALVTVVAVLLAQSTVVAKPLRNVQLQVVSVSTPAAYGVATNRPPRYQPIAFNSSAAAVRIPASDTSKLQSNLHLALQQRSVPQNTKLLSLRVQPQGIYKGIHVDLSPEFLQGGGSASMIDRLTQVVHSATSLNPKALVYISVDGQPLNEDTPIGGEGLSVRYPIDRQQLAQDFPRY
jgi:Sporulation and spore germination